MVGVDGLALSILQVKAFEKYRELKMAEVSRLAEKHRPNLI